MKLRVCVWLSSLGLCLGYSIPYASPTHTLLLCRHGDSVWNGGEPGTHERFTGWTDVSLSRKGRIEARNAAEQVASYSYEIDGLFTSILGRAQDTANECLREIRYARKKEPSVFTDYRLNERHYGALQTFIKKEVEDGKHGHDAADVRKWRRSWHVVPPPLEESDPRRREELELYSHLCGGPEKVPRSESLEIVAKNRVRPFLDELLTPFMDQSAVDKKKGGTGLIVAHANSLRALIGVICEVENDRTALTILESLRIPTGVPLVLKYQQTPRGNYQVCELPGADECIIEYMDGPGMANHPPPDLGHPKLPVWPLNSCIPPQDIFDGNLRVRQKGAPVMEESTVCN